MFTRAALLFVIFSTVFMAVLYATPHRVWNEALPATCVSAGGCFCELTRNNSSVKQPVNAWSSLAFVLTAFLIFLHSRKWSDFSTKLPLWMAYLLGIAAFLTGIGSAFYHASLSLSGQIVDILGMFLLATTMLVYSWYRLLDWNKREFLWVFLLINISLTIVQVVMPETRRYVFAAVLVIALLFEYVYLFRKKPRIIATRLHAALGLFGIAYLIWIFDNNRMMCDPTSLIQGHAVWHILGAISVGLLYLYYFSERDM